MAKAKVVSITKTRATERQPRGYGKEAADVAKSAVDLAEQAAALSKRHGAVVDRLFAICEEQERRLAQADELAADIVAFCDEIQAAAMRNAELQPIVRKAQQFLALRSAQQERARLPRKRLPSLTGRGMEAVIKEIPAITAGNLIDLLSNGQTLTYDEENLELSRRGQVVVVLDLESQKSKTINPQSLGKALKDARGRIAKTSKNTNRHNT